MDAVSRKRTGLWSVPYLGWCVLLRRDAWGALDAAARSARDDGVGAAWEHWEVFAQMGMWLRARGALLRVLNTAVFGHLLSPVRHDSSKQHPELFTYAENPIEWRERYAAPPQDALTPMGGRCTEIFRARLLTPEFCSHLIDEAEAFGEWSGSANDDKRLKGGYEPVPTQDIHFDQFGMDATWKRVLRTLVKPLVEKEYLGYTLKGDETLDFIVRYKPEHQASLRPHFDASTFSVTVTLNRMGVDFEGGGTHYTRQNCTVLDASPGDAVFHPGILTHQHEGLETTRGTRYIVVSFVDQR